VRLTDDLLELQGIDTTLDQLNHRRSHLSERDTAAAADAALRRAEQHRGELAARVDELDVAISALETSGQTLTAQRTRLEGQLKTVIAPREAEALMHELAALAQRRDELDDEELARLEEQSTVADELVALDGQLPELQARAEAARTALAAAEAVVYEELARSSEARSEVVARIDAGLLARYDRLRARLGGVAVARLEGSRCGGCHLDLSTAELAEVRSAGPGEFADCPQCGRLLVP
jgi:uncharacterized protein